MKIGITTHYFKSCNYGGNLQAYALCKWLEQNGYEAEQICFPLKLQPINTIGIHKSLKARIDELIIRMKVFIYEMFHGKYIKKIKNIRIYSKINSRINSVYRFNKNYIPNSVTVYSDKTICETLDCYDCFITGSDIVWAPRYTSSILLLDFVKKDIPKFSYAASLGVELLTTEEKNKYENYLQSFQSISVREQSSVALLEDVVSVPVQLVLDPTLLLKKEQWDKICSAQHIKSKYIFCYFLGENSRSRQLAKCYAKAHCLKLITIPYLNNEYRECDEDFGDEQLFEVSPADFISLIKFAECIFTDSFHACVFSYIYNKNIFAFRRNEKDNIGVRIKNFLTLVNIESHYCDSFEKENIEYIEKLSPAQSLYDNEKVEVLISLSVEYLNENLKQAEESLNKK